MKKCYLSQEANKELADYIAQKGYAVELVKPHANLEEAVSCHPDMYMCQLKDRVYKGAAHYLRKNYPFDVLFNAAAVGPYIICSKHTSLALMMESGLKQVVVPQGYVKCNLVVVDDTHVITSDMGIAKVLRAETEIDVLIVESRHVQLPGYEYGFLGGTSGRIDDEIIFHGNLSKHPDFEAIKAYIEGCGLKLKYFETFPLRDIGSIIVEETKEEEY